MKKPSARTTLIYFDKVRDYFNKGDHIVWDRGTEFQNAKVKEHLDLMGVTVHILPTGGGAFCNPNDNSFFSQVEGVYKRMPKGSHAQAIRAILSAYRFPTEDHVRHYFEHCLLRSKLPLHNEVQALIHHIRKPDKRRKEVYASYTKEYQHYCSNDRHLSIDVRRLELPLAFDKEDLDGQYWTTYK